MILLHQSLPTLKGELYENPSILDNKEVASYFDKEQLKLMRLFLVHDSISYCLFVNQPLVDEFRTQIQESIDKIANELMYW